MKRLLDQLLRRGAAAARAAVPQGERVYAVGDVHGRSDLFHALREAIDADDAARELAQTTVVLLGDLVDRGPDSAGVIASARAWQAERRVRVLVGNHEEMFLASFDDDEVFRGFLRFGGRETALSYPLDAAAFTAADFAEARALMAGAVPADDRAWLGAGEDMIRIGDYLFVHAGIRPGVPLEAQSTDELRWIRQPFLGDRRDHGCVVVHGHSISSEPEVLPNRIGIDTGAYMSGRLTALGLAGTGRWLIEAHDSGNGVQTAIRSI